MDDYPVRVADLLERIAARIRSMTVDRAVRWVTWAALGILLATMVVIAFVLLLVSLLRFLGELIGYEVAYAAVGGIFVLVGMFLWSMRKPRPAE
ncbi:MAG TPA: hypothetical protein VGC47_00100 [Acidimicrobiia bacterium]|jgi:inner membrane protein involved in colicin E2 resistance